MTLAVVLILLVIGTVLFHFLSPWWFTPLASNWGMVDTTVDITFWVTGIVFIAVNLFLAYVVVRYHHHKGQKADYDPENKKLEIWLTVITSIGVAAMLAPGLFVWAKFVNVPDDAAEVEVVGQQWHWSYRYPGEDGEFGTVDPSLISLDNPFGLNPDDINGQDDVLISDPILHLPLDQPVKLLLRSKDVLHNFTVPQFRVKMDMVPGMVTYMWLTPTRTGEFDILCEEFCGIAHFAMRGRVVVQEQQEFDRWLSGQPTYGQLSSAAGGDANTGQALYAVCAACHGAQGEGNQALNAPKLSGQDSWYLSRQLKNYKQGSRGTHPDDVYGQQMVPMVATLTSDQAIKDVVAYIATLPDQPSPATLSGNVRKGAAIYETCASCHGADGRGIWSQNAPRQSGISDWYLARQLSNFKQGIRGSHRNDIYGAQMAAMARILADDEAINDLVAYINTLDSEGG